MVRRIKQALGALSAGAKLERNWGGGTGLRCLISRGKTRALIGGGGGGIKQALGALSAGAKLER